LLTPNGGKLCSTICDNCDCHVFHQYTLRILNNKRDGLAKYFSDLNIPFGIYYPIPLHKQKAYKDSRYIEDDFRNTNLLCKEVISLPMHTELDEDQINFICEKIRDFLE
jgi:dTDP-4-amino-4,6-dideoxygalactose transaminase